MKPAPFAYADPATVEEALLLLAEHGSDAKIMAGGQSLVPMLNMRLVRPGILLDLNRIPELRHTEISASGLTIGAMVRQAELEQMPEVARRWPILAEALAHVAHPQIRNRGTIGGSLAHNDPAAELPAVLVALNGVLTVRGPGGVRRIPASEFFVTYLTTALAPDEILVEIHIPALPTGAGWGFTEVSRRHGDFALVAAAAVLSPGAGGRTEARLVLTGVGSGPVRVPEAEAALAEQGLAAEGMDRAVAAVESAVDPADDVHATAGYRRKVAGVLTRRALGAAIARMGR